MTLEAQQLIAAALLLLPATAWGSMALVAWQNALRRMPGAAVVRVVTAHIGLVALYFAGGALLALCPLAVPLPGRTPVAAARDVCLVVAIALSRHVIPLSVAWAEAPSRRWLVANYGAVALVAAVAAVPSVLPFADPWTRWLWSRGVVLAYVTLASMLGLLEMRRVAIGGGWAPGGGGEVRRADVVWATSNEVTVVAMVVLGWVLESTPRPSLWLASGVSLLGMLGAVPYAVRFMAEGARVFLVAIALFAVTAASVFGVQAALPAPSPGRELVTVVALFVALVPGQAWIRRGVDRLFFRRSRRQNTALQELLRALPPELGVVECCRRCLPEAIRIIQLRGAALFLHSGETFVAGDFTPAALEQVWPRGTAAEELPRRAFGGPEFRILPRPMIEALNAAHVTGVLPIVSPRRRWGDLFATAGLLTAIYSQEDVDVWESFAAQFALVLDAAELVERAVAVERSLRHAEKLAAVGEVTARIAHEIRNPVTAARSLAQQLCREAASPFQAEHEVILVELERVERQVRELLRFARRDELRLATFDLSRLVRATVDALRPRLEAARIGVALDLPDEMRVQGDDEKLRQVLINLVENAIDALDGAAQPRRLAIDVGRDDGKARLRMADSGPGVPADALPHLFEPFFSLKATGTGLGLAIVRRTIDAHGGRIAARAAPGAGLVFEIELPLGARVDDGTGA